MTVPSPEISVLLLDWSSLLFASDLRRRLGLSSVALPMVQSLLTGRLDHVRRLVFGQVVLSGTLSTQHSSSSSLLLIEQRNDRALQVLQQHLSSSSSWPPPQTIALLYGCSHCPDLHQKLQTAGFVAVQSTWRTAWSVPYHKTSNNNSNDTALLASTVAVMYLWVGGLDWISTWQHFSPELGLGYLLRHVLLYVGLSRLFLDWRHPTTTNVDYDYP